MDLRRVEGSGSDLAPIVRKSMLQRNDSIEVIVVGFEVRLVSIRVLIWLLSRKYQPLLVRASIKAFVEDEDDELAICLSGVLCSACCLF